MINISNLQEVTRNNARKATKKANYSIKCNVETSMFLLSEELHNRLGLDDKGFKMYVDPTTNGVALAVLPEADAKFYKKRGSFDRKNRKFKNEEFTAALTKANLIEADDKTVSLDLVSLGEDNGVNYYEVVRVASATPAAEEQAEPASEETNEAAQAESNTFLAEEEDQF